MIGALLALSALSPTVDARPPRHRRPPTHHVRPSGPRVSPRVSVRVGPSWSVRYRPAPRAGYVWVAGAIVAGIHVAGYWRPTTPPPTDEHIWVDGYWDGDEWVDGYWRIDEIDGMIWIDGDYDDTGDYGEGYWLEEQTGTPARAEALPGDAVLAIPAGEEAPAVEEEYVEQPVYPDDEDSDTEIHHAPPGW